MQHSNPAPDSSIRLTWTVIFCLYFAGADNQRIYWISRDWNVDTSVLLSYAQKDERCLFKALHWPVPGLAIVFFFYLKMNLQLLEREGLQLKVYLRPRKGGDIFLLDFHNSDIWVKNGSKIPKKIFILKFFIIIINGGNLSGDKIPP